MLQINIVFLAFFSRYCVCYIHEEFNRLLAEHLYVRKTQELCLHLPVLYCWELLLCLYVCYGSLLVYEAYDVHSKQATFQDLQKLVSSEVHSIYLLSSIDSLH